MTDHVTYTPEQLATFRANTDPCMRLPDGKSCTDCIHCSRCTALFGAFPENTWCDFAPSRFRAKE